MLDRRDEKATIDRLVGGVRDGMSGALVLRGEAGIGKTTLLEYAAACAADLQVSRVVGVEAEMELGFAALHQLVLPFLPGLEQLPPPQRDALACALGLACGNAPDGFLVALAALTLLGNAAAERPVLCAVDDVQWLDQASAAVLAFVARRLVTGGIGMLFAIRDPAERRVALDGVPELTLPGLPDREARELLASVSGVPVNPRVGERIVAETRGNPLALVELGADLPGDVLSGRAPLPEPLPIGRRVEEALRRRVRDVSAEVQTLLLLAAAEPSGDPALLWRACVEFGLDPEVADAPGIDRLLRFTPRIEFRHPMIRSAVYHGATGVARQRAHRALAAASSDGDRDRRAWHLAAAAIGPDEDVAAELERSAVRARDRGGWSAAAACLRRAAALTPDEGRRTMRRLHAAQAELVAGGPAAAAELLEQVTPALSDPGARAEAMRLQAWTRFQLGEHTAILPLLLEAVELTRPLDAARARQILLEAWAAVPYVGEAGWRELARASRDTPRPPHVPECAGDMLLDGFASLDGDPPAGADLLRRAIAVLLESGGADEENPGWLSLGCLAAYVLWDEEAMRLLCARGVRSARAGGALAVLLTRLSFQALSQLMSGQLATADATLAEKRALAAETEDAGRLDCRGALRVAMLARRGRPEEARELAVTVLEAAQEHGEAGLVTMVRGALALLELSLGD
ncbi:MAG: AAA family ATPase, partial [Solirubrobacterales bacterium]|nr:AAA family ATPase [Solirubrobacterales bacterium]